MLLTSDPDTDKCAAAMDVNVGSFSDPEGLEGLAHFLEHMLFYASKKYPLEDSYMKYITEHGGHANAFTASKHTNFQFDVNCDYFEEALDRFAQFFINPLMSPDAMMREIKAVDSENKNNLLSDSWRMYQLQKHVSAKDHPYHKFSTGNWDTLEVRPKAKGLDARDELIKFYEEDYSANLMHLVVYGKKNLDDIQHMVEEKFHGIRNTARSCSIYPGRPCTSEHLQVLIKAVPVKEGQKLNIIWPVTPNIRHYKEGHEGEGSLFFVLKNLGCSMFLQGSYVILDPQSNKGTLIDMKLEKHKNLREESAFFWTQIEDGTLKFDRTESEVAALRELTKKDVIEFFNNYIKIGAPLKKKLSLQVYGGLHSSEYEAVKRNENNCHSICIDDILSFRGSQPLYGSYEGSNEALNAICIFWSRETYLLLLPND
ncbi:insulin-degrading enzyme-like 1, peroxisomal [Amborella trichopoda]|uniref:insulin-degrading enzyme-like 1, peroxisomal n=1 Tax=Amborella trichopoda TaxID=13333 RepID=UPI0009BD220D|nr:insulin-degrading enzyme-like 1, peroxisomal [Amborella trichopoda]|eukprot:XP_020521166.1 insulin-degrading enzyme-like 1, peroxisomal [Amborella trichopoda]